ncbi:hypothetical protein BJX65DRAFT_303579 [Aspergillus insuetus]
MTDRVFEEQVSNILKFTGATRPESNAVFILVLGATGSGQTTFVSKCSGRTLEIGHDLLSCTSELTITSFAHPSGLKTIYLLDTPGFDDTNQSDSETLTHISHYLAVAYANGIYISGIILMHRIIDPRLSGTARLNLNMFKHMLGEPAYENAAIVTSMWSRPPTELEVQREKELLTEDGILAEVLKGDGRAFRYSVSDPEGISASSSPKSLALTAIDHILHQARAGPVILQIQSELVDDKRELIDTSAGRFLADRQVLDLRREYDAVVQGIRDGISGGTLFSSQPENGQADTLMSRRKAQAQVDNRFSHLETRIQENRATLSKTLLQIHYDEERRLEAQMARVEGDLHARIDEKQQYLDNLSKQSAGTPPASAPASTPNFRPRPSPRPAVVTNTQLEIRRLRHEIQELRHEIEQKQAANNSVRHAFRDGILFETVTRVIGGVVGTAIPALVAGSLCVLM